MASITTSTLTLPCAFLKGTAMPQAERVQTYGITGVNGVGVHLLGLFGQPSTIVVQQYGSIAGLNAWYNTLHGLHGVIAVLENDEGQLFPNQLIENVPQPQKRTARTSTGSQELWTVQIRTRTV